MFKTIILRNGTAKVVNDEHIAKLLDRVRNAKTRSERAELKRELSRAQRGYSFSDIVAAQRFTQISNANN